MARSFQMQNSYDKDYNEGITLTFCKIWIAIVSDDGTASTSNEFENLTKLLSINYLKSAPYHPRSNGPVERFIDVFKRAIKKAKKIGIENEELREFLSI